MSYKKVGGLHHVKIGRLGFSFYIAKPNRQRVRKRAAKATPDFATIVARLSNA